jgi:hypothetical protein
MAKRTAELEPEIDTLFQLPLTEFTAARNLLAARLKKEGRPEDADRVKGLQKPTASAWAVNQLFWRQRKDIDVLLGVGERFRKAQAAQLAGKASDMRGLLNERRDALSTLVKHAGTILRDSGHNASPDITRRIMTTLEALATYGDTPGAPRAGRLIDDIDPPGFEALAALVPRGGDGGKHASEPTRVLQFRQEERSRRSKEKKSADDQEARRAKARAAMQEAERALEEAQREAERAEAALKKAAARAKATQKEKEEIEARYEKLQAEAEAATKEARRVAEEAENAAQAVADAERELEKARTALQALAD